MVKIKAVKSVQEYVQEILNISKIKESDTLFFRGQISTGFELVSSLGRQMDKVINDDKKKGKIVHEKQLAVERELIHSAVSKYPEVFGKYDCPLSLLAKLQHYGIYTRLLDVSTNALVGLFFSCYDNNNCPESMDDGEVIVFSAKCYSRYYQRISIISDTYKITRNKEMPLSDYIDCVLQWYPRAFTALDNNNELKNGKPEYIKKMTKDPIFVEPGFIAQRQINQAGKFILLPNIIRDDKLTKDIMTIDKNNDDSIVERIIIKEENKKKILNDLKRFGITREFIFPDDVDTNCRDIDDYVNDMYETEETETEGDK